MTTYNRYKKLRKAIKYGNGSIIFIEPAEYKKGELIETSEYETIKDCEYNIKYEWRVVDIDINDASTFICDGNDLYRKEKEYFTTDDGLTYKPTGASRKGELYESNSNTCKQQTGEIMISNGIAKLQIIKHNYEIININNVNNFSLKTWYENNDYNDVDFFYIFVVSGKEVNISFNNVVLLNKIVLVDFYNINLNSLDTLNVTDMSGMFRGENLTSLDVTPIDTSNVTDMSSMFGACTNLVSLDLSSFYTSNVTDMSQMFSNCENLTSLDLSNFDTSNVTNMSEMFYRCLKLTNNDSIIGLKDIDTSNVTNMSDMFGSCINLLSLDLSNFDTSNVKNMSYMFSDCPNLTSLNLSSFDTSNVIDMDKMFNNCKGLKSLDLSNFDTSKVTSMDEMFIDCDELLTLNLNNWDFRNCENCNLFTDGYMNKNKKLETLKLNNSYLSDIFSGLPNVKKIELNNAHVEHMTSMYYLFAKCTNLVSLNLSSFYTSNVIDMRNMFYQCTNLTSLNLSNFDTSKVTSMSDMFQGCDNLNYIKCKQAFRYWCWNNSNIIDLPAAMQEGGSGTWEIVG